MIMMMSILSPWSRASVSRVVAQRMSILHQIRSLYNDFFCMCVMCHVMACLLTCN